MAFTHNRRPLAEEEKSTDAAKARARAMELLAGQELPEYNAGCDGNDNLSQQRHF